MRAFAIAVVLCACAPISPPQGGETSSTTSTSTGSESELTTRDECTVFEGCASPQTCGCGAYGVCDAGLSFARSTVAGVEEWTLDGDSDCVLVTLASGAAGSFDIGVDYYEEGVYDEASSYQDNIVLIGDGTALFSRDGVPQFVRYARVRPADYFTQCMMTKSVASTAECALDWYEEEICGPVACCPYSEETGAPPTCSADTSG